MTIREIEELSGMTRANIRFYEKEGLITPERNSNGYRNYSEEDLSILKRIRLLRTLHLSLEDIKSLSRNEQELAGLLIRHLTALKKEQQALAHFVKVCEQLCKDRAVYSSFDAQYYLELANFCSKEGQYAKAFNYGIKAADLDQNIAGKAYYLIGTVWGSQSCPGNEIEKRAPYWVAVDYLVKAKNADPSLTEDANKLINSYSSYYPQAAEAFMYNVTEGDSYTVSCGGMRAVTTVKTQQ